MFNLKQSKADPNVVHEKRLIDHRDEFDQKEPDEGATELQMKHNQYKDKDNTVHYEAQLEAARGGTPDCVVERCLETKPTVYNQKRDDRTHGKPIKAPDLVAAAYDQEHREALAEAQQGQDRDTDFWDKHVGVQMIGEPTKIVMQKQKSQLSNTPDRFSNLKPDILQELDNLSSLLQDSARYTYL